MKPTVPEVIDRFRSYHAANPAWGALHVVLDDDNTADMFVDEASEQEARDKGDEEGASLIATLRSMSRTQRRRIARTA